MTAKAPATADSRLDAVIVGGGPAGLSAALVLGRARRRVLVLDEGRPRNAASSSVNGFLSRDGIAPAELLRLGREQLKAYPSVTVETERVARARRSDAGFELETRGGRRVTSRKLILATGTVDELPAVPGLPELYGQSVFHCPYCDGWEMRDQPLAVYGYDEERGGGLAIELLGWSRDVVLCLDGRTALSAAFRARLVRHGVRVREERIERLQGRDGRLERIVFAAGLPLERRALFFYTQRHQGADLAAQLGCEMFSEQGCCVGERGSTNVPGLYIAGDAVRDLMQVAVAAGEGCQTAIAVNGELLGEEFA